MKQYIFSIPHITTLAAGGKAPSPDHDEYEVTIQDGKKVIEFEHDKGNFHEHLGWDDDIRLVDLRRGMELGGIKVDLDGWDYLSLAGIDIKYSPYLNLLELLVITRHSDSSGVPLTYLEAVEQFGFTDKDDLPSFDTDSILHYGMFGNAVPENGYVASRFMINMINRLFRRQPITSYFKIVEGRLYGPKFNKSTGKCELNGYHSPASSVVPGQAQFLIVKTIKAVINRVDKYDRILS